MGKSKGLSIMGFALIALKLSILVRKFVKAFKSLLKFILIAIKLIKKKLKQNKCK